VVEGNAVPEGAGRKPERGRKTPQNGRKKRRHKKGDGTFGKDGELARSGLNPTLAPRHTLPRPTVTIEGWSHLFRSRLVPSALAGVEALA
jgi:hypothetical protein